MLEEIALNAWPAPQQILVDGWVLRLAEGFTRRANSVNPIYRGQRDVEEKIAFCERLYRARGLPVIFKMTSAVEPADLDQRLEERGYRIDVRAQVQCMDLGRAPVAEASDAKCWPGICEEWITQYMAFNDVPAHRREILSTILQGIACPVHSVILMDEGKAVACGMAVLQGEYVGLFDIVTCKERRRRGLGTKLVRALLAWGQGRGARKSYLQVMMSNTPALGLYRKLGFEPAYQYWYRCL
ncbi:MAG: GNAT family N-acetyltransferase [Bacillota bacterium]